MVNESAYTPPLTDGATSVAERARRRVTRRLMPYLFLLYIIAYLDRVNVGYAALEMTNDLGFTPEVYGFGAGIFFVGYFLLEIPGCVLVERWSARRWQGTRPSFEAPPEEGVDLLWDSGGNMRADIGFSDGYNSRNTDFQDPPTNAFDFGVHGRFEWLVFGKDFRRYTQFTNMGAKGGDDFLVLGAGGDWSQNGDVNLYHMNVDGQWNSGPWGVYVAWVGLYGDPGSGGSRGKKSLGKRFGD